MIVASSCSGGKNSCLAYYKAIEQGYQVKYLLNFISLKYKRCCFHGVEASLLRLQADLIGIPLFQKEVTPDMQKYEKEFKEAVCELKSKGIEGMVFGDVYLDEHKEWVERVCRDLGITPIEPLWNDLPPNLIKELINLGFKAVVVSCQADKFGKEFVGRFIDKDLLAELKSSNICPCGENGEFHTFVVDGPIFKKRIDILESEPVLKEDFWKYWFLDIKRYKVKNK